MSALASPSAGDDPFDVPLRMKLLRSVWPGSSFTLYNSRLVDGAVMACAGTMLVWWDRDVDSAGRPIRADVRSAGHDLWRRACQETMAVLADQGPAAELMEDSVARVSRYLDRIDAPLAPRKHGLVMVAFCRALRRYRAKSARLEPQGDSSDFGDLFIEASWLSRSDARLDLEKIVRKLSDRGAEVLMLRAAGYEWKKSQPYSKLQLQPFAIASGVKSKRSDRTCSAPE